jgi:hypothetical protein
VVHILKKFYTTLTLAQVELETETLESFFGCEETGFAVLGNISEDEWGDYN